MPVGSLPCFTDEKKKNQVNGQKRLEPYDYPCKKHLKLVPLAGGKIQCWGRTPSGFSSCQCTFEEGTGEVERKH